MTRGRRLEFGWTTRAVRMAVLACGVAAASCYPAIAVAQSLPTTGAPEQEPAEADDQTLTAAQALQRDIVVTATKRVENVQDVPLAITAFGSEQLETLNYQDLSSLSYTMPNVQLDDNGSTIGFQNFAIRGLGINSSSPSIDPTVGVFVDGVYLGTNAGVLFDNFDLEAVEVLRGPQGVLFGRNVTGGAVLLRTRRPSDTLTVRSGIGVETGLAVTADAAVSGPIVPGKVSAKLAAYYRYDDGWFTNLFDGSEFGKSRQFTVRPVLRWTPTEDVELLLRYEHTDASGDSSAVQNHALFSRKSFDFSNNEPGFFTLNLDSATVEANVDVGFGDGKITNIFGWRSLVNDGLGDIDGTPLTSFHFFQITEQEQFSNELRYAGTFGSFDLTTGLYYFTQDLKYVEQRILAGGAVVRGGGGEGQTDVFGAFAALDWHLTDTLTLSAGGRYTREKKDVDIGTIRTGGGSYATRSFVPDFADQESWSDFSPRIGVQFEPSDATNLYAYFARGFRSGGYNFRATVVGASPGPFDSEQQDSFEIGLKQKLFDNRGRVNIAVFNNTIKDIQREVQVPIAGVGIAQLIQNVGTVRIRGFEVDGQFAVTNNLVIGGYVGHTDGDYTSLRFDLNGDNTINERDFALQLPRLSPWTYGANVVLDIPLADWGTVSTRLSYNHRDKAFHLENNLGFYNEMDTFDFNVTLTPSDSPITFSVYGKNITNEANYTNDAVLPDVAMFGGDGPAGPRALPTFSPLIRGRIFGAELRFKY